MRLPYTFRISPRARALRITVHASGEVTVTVPQGVSEARARAWAHTKHAWVERARARIRVRAPRIALPAGSDAYRASRERAHARVFAHVKELNAVYGYSFATVRIKRHTSRWGSCSSKKNLNFNFQIAFLPDILARYIVAHELCHLKEMNHSRAFWREVARTVPSYRSCQKQLRAFHTG